MVGPSLYPVLEVGLHRTEHHRRTPLVTGWLCWVWSTPGCGLPGNAVDSYGARSPAAPSEPCLQGCSPAPPLPVRACAWLYSIPHAESDICSSSMSCHWWLLNAPICLDPSARPLCFKFRYLNFYLETFLIYVFNSNIYFFSDPGESCSHWVFCSTKWQNWLNSCFHSYMKYHVFWATCYQTLWVCFYQFAATLGRVGSVEEVRKGRTQVGLWWCKALYVFPC